VTLVSNQPPPNRRKDRLLCGAKDSGLRLLPGQSGTGQPALPLPRWQIDKSEDGGGACSGPVNSSQRLTLPAAAIFLLHRLSYLGAARRQAMR
jgi:hypothetical protein